MKIPTHWEEQHKRRQKKHREEPDLSTRSTRASDFKFTLPNAPAGVGFIPLSPEDEGKILFFPAWLIHEVFPFRGKGLRRTISFNLSVEF